MEVGAGEEHSLLYEHIAVYRFGGARRRPAAPGGSSVADVRVIILRLSSVRMPDDSGANALVEFIVDTQRQGITVLLKGIRPEHAKIMDSVGVRRVV
ncbi:MAG: sodium-independent anion transporter [Actinomycetales bacterium]|nr:sodium-independent anion transporter [Actinomycetales bacterium]